MSNTLSLPANTQIILTVSSGAYGIVRDKTMDDKSIYIPNEDKQNYSLCSLIWFKSLVTTISKKNIKSNLSFTNE